MAVQPINPNDIDLSRRVIGPPPDFVISLWNELILSNWNPSSKQSYVSFRLLDTRLQEACDNVALAVEPTWHDLTKLYVERGWIVDTLKAPYEHHAEGWVFRRK